MPSSQAQGLTCPEDIHAPFEWLGSQPGGCLGGTVEGRQCQWVVQG
jgi:hypothetical protein